MTKDEALKIAIESMQFEDKSWECEHGFNHNECPNEHCIEKNWFATIQACKEALEQPMINGLTETETNQTMSVKGLSEQPAQEPVAWMRSALDNARDVCKYLDHDMIKDAKAHTKFFWNDLDKIRDFDNTHPAPSCKCEECGMKYCECGERK